MHRSASFYCTARVQCGGMSLAAPSSRTLFATLIGLVVIIAAGATAFFVWRWWSAPAPAFVLQLAAGGILFEQEGDALVARQVAGQPEGTVITDKAYGKDSMYYLALEQTRPVAQVYKVMNDRWVPLTNSPTYKYDLAVSEQDGYLAFIAGTVATSSEMSTYTDWEVIVAGLSSLEEVERGAGVSVETVWGKHTLLVERTDGLYATPPFQGEPLLVFTGSPYAVDATGTRFAMYNSATGAVDTFVMRYDVLAATHEGSTPISSRPTALSFKGASVNAAWVNEEQTEMIYGDLHSRSVQSFALPFRTDITKIIP